MDTEPPRIPNNERALTHLEVVFREVELQASAALVRLGAVHEHVRLTGTPVVATSQDEREPSWEEVQRRAEEYHHHLWMSHVSAHEVLLHTSAVARLLRCAPLHRHRARRQGWEHHVAEANRQRDARGRFFRLYFELAQHPTLMGRELRDSIEHFDERIEAWAHTTPIDRLELSDTNQNPLWVKSFASTPDLSIFRHFVEPNQYAVFGDQVDLVQLERDLRDVHSRARRWNQSGHKGVVILDDDGRHVYAYLDETVLS